MKHTVLIIDTENFMSGKSVAMEAIRLSMLAAGQQLVIVDHSEVNLDVLPKVPDVLIMDEVNHYDFKPEKGRWDNKSKGEKKRQRSEWNRAMGKYPKPPRSRN